MTWHLLSFECPSRILWIILLSHNQHYVDLLNQENDETHSHHERHLDHGNPSVASLLGILYPVSHPEYWHADQERNVDRWVQYLHTMSIWLSRFTPLQWSGIHVMNSLEKCSMTLRNQHYWQRYTSVLPFFDSRNLSLAIFNSQDLPTGRKASSVTLNSVKYRFGSTWAFL